MHWGSFLGKIVLLSCQQSDVRDFRWEAGGKSAAVPLFPCLAAFPQGCHFHPFLPCLKLFCAGVCGVRHRGSVWFRLPQLRRRKPPHFDGYRNVCVSCFCAFS